MSSRGFRWRRCAGCASLFVGNPPPAEAIARLYQDEGYFADAARAAGGDGGPLGYRDYLADRSHIEAKFDRVLERLERYSPPGDLLDAGAGPGLLLDVARRRRWRPSGVDANPWAAAYARERIGVDVSTGFFGATGLASARFEAVTMMDFLEHLPAPGDAVAEAARLTRPGGLLAVLTPKSTSLAGRLLGPRWPEAAKAPGHLVIFSPRGLSRLLRGYGYEVLGWHSVGKTSTAETLLRDAAPIAPTATRLLGPLVHRVPPGRRVVTIDPRTKLCLYARLGGSAAGPGRRRAEPADAAMATA